MRILFAVRDVKHHSPIGLLQIAAMARLRGDELHLSVLSTDDVIADVRRIAPQVVAFSATSGEHTHYGALAREVKRRFPEVVTVMGGPHATFFPNPTLDRLRLDAVCVGEGDYAFVDLLDRVARDGDLEGLDNMVTPALAASGRAPRLKPLVQDLDALPHPERRLLFDRTELGVAPIKNFMVSRGCPYQCSYCFNKPFRAKYPHQVYLRRHSVDYVIEEIGAVKAEYPMQFVKFYDDVFTLGVDAWLEEFARRYKAAIGLPFYCLTAPDVMTRDLALLLREAGCHTIQMAVESVNDRIRTELLHRRVTRTQMMEAIRTCADLGLTVVTNYMLGLPTSTVEDDLNAVYFNIEAGVPVPEFPIYQPYPGTELGERCAREGWFDGDCDQLHMSYNYRSVLTCFSEPQKDVQRNIAYLGQLASSAAGVWPSLTEFLLRHVVHQPTHPLFAEIYTRHKWELYHTKVYPLDHTVDEERLLREKSLRLGLAERTPGKDGAHDARPATEGC